jgi:hypothetical protein
LRFLGQIESVAGNVGIGLVKHRQVVGVAVDDVGAKVVGEVHDSVLERT